MLSKNLYIFFVIAQNALVNTNKRVKNMCTCIWLPNLLCQQLKSVNS